MGKTTIRQPHCRIDTVAGFKRNATLLHSDRLTCLWRNKQFASHTSPRPICSVSDTSSFVPLYLFLSILLRVEDPMELLLPKKPAAAAAASALISPSPEPAGTEEVIDKLKPPEPN
jgi:hypothetical protein